MLWLAMTLKLVTEVALMAMLGQWVLAHWPGVVPGVNPFWRLLDWISAPFVRGATRWPWPVNHPSQARRRAVLALLALWLLATTLKVTACLHAGVRACQ